MNDIELAASRLANRAMVSAIRNDLTTEEAALRLIAGYENSKDEFAPKEQEVMRQVTLRAVMLITGRAT
jgi:hypothetical protein